MSPIKPSLGQLRFRSLLLLDVLLECGSLHAAADKLHLTQPALSSMLREIESAFGGQLFERSPKGMAPNAVGRVVIDRARLIVNELRNAEQAAHQIREGTSELKLGVIPMMMLDIVPSALQKFAERYPNTRIFISEGNVPTLCRALVEGNMDMVLSRPDPLFASTPGLTFLPLLKEDPCVMTCPSHHIFRRKEVRWENLIEEKWILPPRQTFTWQNFAQAFIIRGLVPPEAHYECASFHSNVRLASKTSALMVAPSSVGAHYEHLGLVKRLKLKFPGVLAPVSLIQRSERPDSLIVNDFINTLQVLLN